MRLSLRIGLAIALSLTVSPIALPDSSIPDDVTPHQTAQPGGGGRLQQLRERLAGGAGGAAADIPKLKRVTWKIGDDTREALVYVPPAVEGKRPPVIFAFHGHGGNDNYSAKKFNLSALWPEAVCVYPQGLPTAVPKIDPNGTMPGWQKSIGDENDRDLKFFDAMLKSMKDDYKIDDSRVYVMGHSNGGFFTYTLWAARGDEITAFAPIAADINPRDAKAMKPKPVLHVAGEKDPLVNFSGQQLSMEADRKIDACDPTGKPAGKFCTEYTSKTGPTVITFIHPGGHEVPDGAVARIVEFFKDQKGK